MTETNQRKKIFFTYPSTSSRPVLRSMHSVWAHITNCHHDCLLHYSCNESLVSRMRNASFAHFLKSVCEWYISIDDDIEICNSPSKDNFIDKLIAHNKDFVGGLYALKKEGPGTSSSTFDRSVTEVNYNSGLVRMHWLSAGIWCIHRRVIEKIVDAHPELMYEGENQYNGGIFYDICGPRIVICPPELTGRKKPFRKLLSEDWSLCEYAREQGFEIFADTSIISNHIGGNGDHYLLGPGQENPVNVPKTEEIPIALDK